MRRSWVAIAVIALAVGLTAFYRGGRPVDPPRAIPESDPGPETRSEESPAPAPVHASPRIEAPVPEYPHNDETPALARVQDDRPPFEAPTSMAAAPPTPPSPPAVLARGEGAPPPAPPPFLEPVPAPAVPHASPAAAPAPVTGAAIEDPDARDESPAFGDDEDSDRQAPVLESLRFDPPEIKDGGVTVLSVGTTDDLSGVKFVSGAVQSPNESAVVSFTAYDAGGSGVFTAALVIPHRAETGDWFVATLQVSDRADNHLNLNFTKQSVPQGGLLRVVSAESDSSAPSLRGITVDRGQVDPGDKNRILVEAEDDRSGVASVTGAFENRSKTALIPFTCHPSGELVWEAEIGVPENADCGEWTLRHLILTDNAKNTAVLNPDDPQVGRAGFFVTGGGACDAAAPVIDGMYFSPPVVSNASAAEIVLTVRVHDEGSGVASLFGRIEGPAAPNGQVARIAFECVPDPADPETQMTARIPVPQYAARGVWSVIWVHATDKARNAHPYYKGDPALAGGSFTVE